MKKEESNSRTLEIGQSDRYDEGRSEEVTEYKQIRLKKTTLCFKSKIKFNFPLQQVSLHFQWSSQLDAIISHHVLEIQRQDGFSYANSDRGIA